ADGGGWPAVEGLDGPGLLGSHIRVVRSRLVRVSLPHRARFGIFAGAARACWLGARAAGYKVYLHPDHAARRDAVAPASIIARHSHGAHPAQDQRPLVVG